MLQHKYYILDRMYASNNKSASFANNCSEYFYTQHDFVNNATICHSGIIIFSQVCQYVYDSKTLYFVNQRVFSLTGLFLLRETSF